MRILGVDPGLKATGYGIINFDGTKIKLIEAGTIEPRESDLIQNRIQKIYKNLDELIEKHQPAVMILEKLYTHYQHPTTASILGHVRGVICLLCAQRHIELVEESVKRIRQSLVGRGEASKPQTQGMVSHVLKIPMNQLTTDASDALALALGYIHIHRNKL
jgi:crossover junction endodeoxyribonuclease RuvC